MGKEATGFSIKGNKIRKTGKGTGPATSLPAPIQGNANRVDISSIKKVVTVGKNKNVVLEGKVKGFAVIDFETTGFSPSNGDKAIQLAIVRTDLDGNIVDNWESYIQPNRPLEQKAMEINKITADMLVDAPTFDKIAPEIIKRLKGYVLVAQNLPFDARFMDAEMAEAGFKWSSSSMPKLDTKTTAPEFFGSMPSYSLKFLLEKAEITADEGGRGFAHDAMTDTIATAKLLKHFINQDKQSAYNNVTNIE